METLGQETPSFDPIGVAKDAAWRAVGDIASNFANERPDKGKKVIVIGGRKHKGKAGVVFWHGPDFKPYRNRYCTDIQRAMRDARGRDGFRVGIISNNNERFFCPANQVQIVK